MKREKKGRTESNVCRKAKTWIPSPFAPQKPLPFLHDHHKLRSPPHNCAALPDIIDSLAVDTVRSEARHGQLLWCTGIGAMRLRSSRVPQILVCYLSRRRCARAGRPHTLLEAFSGLQIGHRVTHVLSIKRFCSGHLLRLVCATAFWSLSDTRVSSSQLQSEI